MTDSVDSQEGQESADFAHWKTWDKTIQCNRVTFTQEKEEKSREGKTGANLEWSVPQGSTWSCPFLCQWQDQRNQQHAMVKVWILWQWTYKREIQTTCLFWLALLVLFPLGPLTSDSDASQSRVEQSLQGHWKIPAVCRVMQQLHVNLTGRSLKIWTE